MNRGKQMEEALRASEERFRRLSEAAFEGIVIHEKGKILEVNQVLATMFGYEPSELLGMSGLDMVTPESREVLLQHILSGSEEPYEAVGIKKDGTTFPLEIHGKTTVFEGRVVRVGAVRDITERKRAEAALRESEEKYRDLVENINEAIYIVDCDGRITYASPVIERVIAYPLSEVIGHLFREFIYPEDLLSAQENFQRGLSGEIESAEFRVVTKAGEVRWMRTSGRPIIEEGSVAGFRGMLMNITEHKRAEEELAQLRKAVETSGEVVFLTDRDGIITFINPEFTRLYGYTAEDVIGKVTPRILKSGTATPQDYEMFWRTLVGKQVVKGEFINRTKDGRLVNVEGSANPVLDDHGNIVGFLAIQRDVTEHKRLEEQYRQAQKMEAVGRLAGGIAHDFNNLLTIILGSTDFAMLDTPGDHAVRNNLLEIKQAAMRAANLTRQLLTFARRQIIAPRILNLNDLMLDLDKMLQRLIGEDIELVTLPAPELSSVKVDPGQVEQVVVNLAVNARDAMPHGGKLTLETANVTLSHEYARQHPEVIPGEYVMLAVSDTGAGMTEEVKTHLFEPFFTTKEVGKGTGLGLATCYGIVKQSGGHIGVYSELGQGTTVKIYLPRVEEATGGPVRRDKTGVLPQGTETVLVVEDEMSVRTMVIRLLRMQGYNVLEAANGEEAMEMAQTHAGETVHLLLTDVVMPQMGGREVAERLQAMWPDLKVLFMSGYTDDAIVHNGVLGKGTPFLQKPFTPDALARKVREVLNSRKTL